MNATQGVGSEAIIDVEVRDTPIFIRTSVSSQGQLRGSLVLNNIELYNVKTAVGVASGEVLLQGGKHKIIDTWAQGNMYSTSVYHKFVQAEVASPYKPASLLDKHGRIVSKMHPQYEDISVDRFLSARDHGCKGDGHTDETQALQTLLNKVSWLALLYNMLLTILLGRKREQAHIYRCWCLRYHGHTEGPRWKSCRWRGLVSHFGEREKFPRSE